MPNYKQQPIHSIELGGNSYTIKPNETLIKLISGGNNTTGKSFETELGVSYQVPSGKTFKAIGMQISAGSSPRTFTLYQSDAEDLATNPVNKDIHVDWPASGMYEVPFASPTFLADKFVNHKVNSVSTVGDINFLVGVEY